MTHVFAESRRFGVLAAVAAAAAAWTLAPGAGAQATERPLRVCAQPDALPFSNHARQGYENRIADLVGHALRRPVAYVWEANAADAVDALSAGRCDVMMGVPAQLDAIATTDPYYTSSYVLVSRADRAIRIDSLKDDRLKALRIGAEKIEGSRVETPPLRALADRGLLHNVVAYLVAPDASDGPRARMIGDVARGTIDVAVLWGPVAGYFARRSPAPLTLTTITDTDQFSARKRHIELISFQYDISMGVRKSDAALRAALNRTIAREHRAITSILAGFGVPLLKLPQVASLGAPADNR